MLTLLKENFIDQHKDNNHVFEVTDFDHPDFRRKLSDYLLGEVKDQILFYYSAAEYELFLKFFEYLNGSLKFTYDEFIDAYFKFNKFILDNEKIKPAFCETADEFLQFLYDLNIMCYVERSFDENFIRWCYQERGYSNISPKVKTNLRYEIHYGFGKALNLGKRVF